MSDWRRVPIGEVFEVQLGKMLGAGSEHGTQYQYLANRNVQWGRVVIDDLGTMNFSVTERERYRLRSGDLLVCEGGEVGRAALWSSELPECYFQNAIHRLRATSPIIPLFMRHYFEFAATAGSFRALTGQTSIGHLPRSHLVRWLVPVPPVEEQRRIAEILDTVDKSIKDTERVIAKRRTILAGLQTSLFKASDGASWTTVGDLVSHHWPGEWGKEAPSDGFQEVTVLRATNLDDYGINYSTGARRFVTGPKVADKRLMAGDLLVEAAGGGPGLPVGRVRRFQQPAGDTPYLTSNFFRTLRPKAGIDPDYLFWLLDNEYRKPSIWSCQQQTTGIINLKIRDYLERSVIYHHGSQVAIAQALNSALGAVEAERQQLRKLREMRSGLSADLLSGRARTVAA